MRVYFTDTGMADSKAGGRGGRSWPIRPQGGEGLILPRAPPALGNPAPESKTSPGVRASGCSAAYLRRSTILDFRGLRLKHDLNSKGWNSQAHREFPGKFESSNLSRDNLS